MLDGRKRLSILVGIGVLLALVLAVQQFWPWGDETRTAAPTIAPTVTPTPDPEARRPAPASTPGAAEGQVTYARLLVISQQPTVQDLPVLKKAARSPSWEERHAAVVGIGRLKEKGDPATLLAMLTNANERPEVRAQAAEELGAMKYIDAGPALIEAMSDDSLLVRSAAGVAISAIMGMRFEFSARDPADKRQEAIARTRNCWDLFYKEIQLRRSRGG